jgi:hypothetical protein
MGARGPETPSAPGNKDETVVPVVDRDEPYT